MGGGGEFGPQNRPLKKNSLFHLRRRANCENLTQLCPQIRVLFDLDLPPNLAPEVLQKALGLEGSSGPENGPEPILM